MKTTNKYSAMMMLFILMHVSVSAQHPVVVKTSTITLYAAEKYEASKQRLFAMIDSCNSRLVSLNETKTDNGNQKAVIELAASDSCFMIIDKQLPDLGYVSYKNLKTLDKSAELDTVYAKKDIVMLKERKAKYEQQLAQQKSDSELYKEIWKKIVVLDDEIYTKEKTLEYSRTELLKPHRMVITLCE